MALDAVPFVGTVKGIQEVLMGKDLITGQQLSVADRVAEGERTLLSFLPDGKLLGTFLTKEAIDGGEWAWKQVGKEAEEGLVRSAGHATDSIDPVKFDRMKKAFEKQGGIIDQSEEAIKIFRLPRCRGCHLE